MIEWLYYSLIGWDIGDVIVIGLFIWMWRSMDDV